MDDTQNAPSVSQAKRIKELAQKGQFTSDAVVAIMGEEKKGELDTVTIKNDILRKYFPRSYTPRQMEEKIIQLLDAAAPEHGFAIVILILFLFIIGGMLGLLPQPLFVLSSQTILVILVCGVALIIGLLLKFFDKK